MRNRLSVGLWWVVGLSLAGCDVLYGVRREQALKDLPDLACVERVVRSVSGVVDVKYSTSQGGRPLTLSGVQEPDQISTFIYSGKQPAIWGVLQLLRDAKSRVRFSQYHLVFNHPPDPSLIANTRLVMREIERNLSKDCGMNELPDAVKETCSGVDCPPMS